MLRDDEEWITVEQCLIKDLQVSFIIVEKNSIKEWITLLHASLCS